MLESGPFRAASKKTAEQLAAQGLLNRVAEEDRANEAIRVTEDDAARLLSTNPKGRLLEWCAKRKTAPPRFEQDASPDGYRVRGVLALDDQHEIATTWVVSPKLKSAEQAAAEAILQQLPNEPPAESQPAIATRQASTDSAPEPSTSRNAAMVLNELTQAGLLQATGYELLDQTGPSHQPTFTVVAWATTSHGQTVRTEPTGAPSKKSAQRTAADRLLDLLVDEGITRR
jgi:dsRNA-specific ribonuclease